MGRAGQQLGPIHTWETFQAGCGGAPLAICAGGQVFPQLDPLRIAQKALNEWFELLDIWTQHGTLLRAAGIARYAELPASSSAAIRN